MKRIAILFLGIATCLLVSGCYVAEPQSQAQYVPYAGGETYFYYPAYELYYYPAAGEWYWYNDNRWHHNRKIPDRFKNVVSDRDRVVIQWPREPHLDHAQIRAQYPPPATAYRPPRY
ncbi:MAG TPA: hypothetical protein VGH16_14845 [Candidatus Binatia bacterium]